jgi:hypothetical protein
LPTRKPGCQAASRRLILRRTAIASKLLSAYFDLFGSI